MKRNLFLSLSAILLSFFSFADTYTVTLPNGTTVTPSGGHIYCPDGAYATFKAEVTYNAGFVYNITYELFLDNTLIKSQQLSTNASGIQTYEFTMHVVPGVYKMRVKKGVNPTFDLGSISMDEVPNYTGYAPGSTWTSQLTGSDGFTQSNGTLRLTGDVNGDGKDDLIGFGTSDVTVALSNGSSFGAKSTWHNGWSNAQSWNNSALKRCVADVNGDGKVDIVGFGSDGVYVSLSTGTSFGTSSVKWSNGWGTNNGWNNSNGLQREVVDVNGDGKADIVGFTNGGTYVALSTGTAFGSQTNWSTGWGPDNSWGLNGNQRVLGDVTGDGKADIVGFTSTGVYVAKSNGTSFLSSSMWTTAFSNNYGWDNSQFMRTLGDVDGNGSADIIGFGYDGVQVAKSNGSSSFYSSQRFCSGYDVLYGYGQVYPRLVGDFNNNGTADVAGLGSVITVSLSNESYACEPWFKSLNNIKNNYANFGEEITNLGQEEMIITANNLDIYPNPSNGNISLTGMDVELTYELTFIDMRGVILKKGTVSSMNNSISIDELEAGNYMIVISCNQYQTIKQLVKF